MKWAKRFLICMVSLGVLVVPLNSIAHENSSRLLVADKGDHDKNDPKKEEHERLREEKKAERKHMKEERKAHGEKDDEYDEHEFSDERNPERKHIRGKKKPSE